MMVRAGELLDTMRIRLGMQEDGVTHPTEAVKIATRMLVEKLTPLPARTKIKITTKGDTGKYILASTGEVLAEIPLTEQDQST